MRISDWSSDVCSSDLELNGVEDLLYMASTSNSNGSASITVTFESGTDIDKAQMDVQNQLTLVEQRLPEEVRRQGIPVRQANAGFLMLIAVGSKSGQTAQLELGNFANARILDELRRVEGVGSVQVFASPYAMRIWLDPEKLANYSLSAAEALAAVQVQNNQSQGGDRKLTSLKSSIYSTSRMSSSALHKKTLQHVHKQ